MEIKRVNIDELIPASYNPRIDLTENDFEYKELEKSINNLGYCLPIIINKNGVVIGGHQRLKVLKNNGYKEIDVVVLDLEEDKEKALNIILNKVEGNWDRVLLHEFIEINKDKINLYGLDEIDSRLYESFEPIEKEYDGITIYFEGDEEIEILNRYLKKHSKKTLEDFIREKIKGDLL